MSRLDFDKTEKTLQAALDSEFSDEPIINKTSVAEAINKSKPKDRDKKSEEGRNSSSLSSTSSTIGSSATSSSHEFPDDISSSHPFLPTMSGSTVDPFDLDDVGNVLAKSNEPPPPSVSTTSVTNFGPRPKKSLSGLPKSLSRELTRKLSSKHVSATLLPKNKPSSGILSMQTTTQSNPPNVIQGEDVPLKSIFSKTKQSSEKNAKESNTNLKKNSKDFLHDENQLNGMKEITDTTYKADNEQPNINSVKKESINSKLTMSKSSLTSPKLGNPDENNAKKDTTKLNSFQMTTKANDNREPYHLPIVDIGLGNEEDEYQRILDQIHEWKRKRIRALNDWKNSRRDMLREWKDVRSKLFLDKLQSTWDIELKKHIAELDKEKEQLHKEWEEMKQNFITFDETRIKAKQEELFVRWTQDRIKIMKDWESQKIDALKIWNYMREERQRLMEEHWKVFKKNIMVDFERSLDKALRDWEREKKMRDNTEIERLETLEEKRKDEWEDAKAKAIADWELRKREVLDENGREKIDQLEREALNDWNKMKQGIVSSWKDEISKVFKTFDQAKESAVQTFQKDFPETIDLERQYRELKRKDIPLTNSMSRKSDDTYNYSNILPPSLTHLDKMAKATSVDQNSMQGVMFPSTSSSSSEWGTSNNPNQSNVNDEHEPFNTSPTHHNIMSSIRASKGPKEKAFVMPQHEFKVSKKFLDSFESSPPQISQIQEGPP